MSILVVGADHLGDITTRLEHMGCNCLTHIRGRKNFKKNKVKIPSGTDLVLVMTDYVNHNISSLIKNEAKSKSIPVIYAKRSWSSIAQKLYDKKDNNYGKITMVK